MNTRLTEGMIRGRANEQSFEKGRAYYRSGTIFNPMWQSSAGGVVLTAQCEGSSAPAYRLRVELDAGGVRSADCSCPYDWGGDCKHIVALLLLYLHKHDEFSEQKRVGDLLAGMEKDTLTALVERLVERNPDLYDEIEMALPMVKIGEVKSSPAKGKRKTQVSEQAYRKQVKRILKQSRYDEGYYDDWRAPAHIEDLDEIAETAAKFLDAGDAEGALVILRVLLEETLNDYDGEMDYNGDVASFIQSLGMPMAEAILSLEMDSKARDELQNAIEGLLDDLDEVIERSELDVIPAALEYGWSELPDREFQGSYELKQARLNVLKRQGRTDEFLQLAKKADIHQYVLQLIQLGRLDEAVKSSKKLKSDSEIFSVTQQLREAGRLDDAITLAERGLNLKGNSVYELATWLAPLEELQGRKEMALLAYRVAFDAQPEVELYRHVKRLAGADWENIRPALLKKAGSMYASDVLVDIHLEEKEWEAAIKIAEKDFGSYRLLERVADAVIPHRPDWVIRVSLKHAEELIEKTQSNLYPAAARWLERAKKVYQLKGQTAEWKAYIADLRAKYARRPSLQKAIAGL